ncbi:MAG: hypothetical protein IJ308_03900 [Clostridia bacterium]|nr:hypothetical protein [Clostridia bacterium]
MKKKWMAVACMTFASMFAFGACGVSGGGDSTNTAGGYLQKDPLNLGEGFDAAYYPVIGEEGGIQEQSGVLTVAILFEGTESGWEAVAKEYSRLHRDQVTVKLDNQWTASNYPNKLDGELDNNKNTTWDIVQGNLASQGKTSKTCINMNTYVSARNGYAGNKFWSQVLEQDAYLSDKTGANTATYIMNTEGLETAWFVNDVAFNAAVEAGYSAQDANGNPAKPQTWAELMDLCKYMEDAGYQNPLGISLTTDSISASQFTWLLRVYGDLYYRNEYDNIMMNGSTFKVDLTSPDPETDSQYKYSETKLFHSLFDENYEFGDHYVGATSEKFQDFVEQFGLMIPYLRLDALNKSMVEMRSLFQYQTEGMSSPQIMLDYVGSGLGYTASETDSFKVDFFDYPIMESEFIKEGTLVRDVGGNGGYLSVVDHGDRARNALAVDFVKFFMSPYGQTIYYDALSAKGVAPKGLTLVKNNLVRIPQAWKDYFETDKISFTGLSDSNPYITYFIRGLADGEESTAQLEYLWTHYLMQKEGVSARNFGGKWFDALFNNDWEAFCKKNGWNVNCWKYPESDDVYYGGAA